MTLAEINRAIESKRRVMEYEDKKQATYVYLLADLIGVSVSRIHNKSSKMPTIGEVFPHLFDTEEERQKKEEQEVARFKAQLLQFTNSHNKKIKGVK